MKKFEYHYVVEGADSDLLDDQANALGEVGWELISVYPTGKDNSYLGMWFKRELNPK